MHGVPHRLAVLWLCAVAFGHSVTVSASKQCVPLQSAVRLICQEFGEETQACIHTALEFKGTCQDQNLMSTSAASRVPSANMLETKRTAKSTQHMPMNLGETSRTTALLADPSMKSVKLLADGVSFSKSTDDTTTIAWNRRCPSADMVPTTVDWKDTNGTYIGIAMSFKCLPTYDSHSFDSDSTNTKNQGGPSAVWKKTMDAKAKKLFTTVSIKVWLSQIHILSLSLHEPFSRTAGTVQICLNTTGSGVFSRRYTSESVWT